MQPEVRIGAVVLAAGQARRFGRAKLLADFAGRAIVAHVLDTVREARRRGLVAHAVVVVTESDREIQELARQSGAEPVVNADSGRGLSSSLALGLSALPAELDAALILLGDQPLVRLEVIEAMLRTWQAASPVAIRPRYAEATDIPGHPVLLSRSAWPLAKQLEGDSGFGGRFAPDAPGVTIVDVPGDNPDIDTPVDLLLLRDRR